MSAAENSQSLGVRQMRVHRDRHRRDAQAKILLFYLWQDDRRHRTAVIFHVADFSHILLLL